MHDHSRNQAVARSGVCRKKCRRHEMFIDEKRSWFSRSSELSEMLGISLNSEENKMGMRASYKHYAATRLAQQISARKTTAVVFAGRKPVGSRRQLRQRKSAARNTR